MAGAVEIVDQLMAARKTLGGIPQWRPVGERGEYRQVIPLDVDGVGTDCHVELNAYPNITDELRFRIMIFAPQCVWRVDYVTDETHVNPLGTGLDIPDGLFAEPHYHAWADNRRFSNNNALSNRLPIARILPNLRTFDATFRWFCGETNIAQPPAGLIELPPRTSLL